MIDLKETLKKKMSSAGPNTVQSTKTSKNYDWKKILAIVYVYELGLSWEFEAAGANH